VPVSKNTVGHQSLDQAESTLPFPMHLERAGARTTYHNQSSCKLLSGWTASAVQVHLR
jgi:hypothetical protein